MASQLYLVKEGEISLKGQNRSFFEKQLKHNIKDKLRPYHSQTERQKGRLFFYIDASCPKEVIDKAFSTTYGVVGYAKACLANKTIEGVFETAEKVLRETDFSNVKTFKIETKREDKSFPLSSYEINCRAAEILGAMHPELKVNLVHPDFTLHIEIRSQVYIYTDAEKGPGGLPSGSAGRGLLLLSGGIDSPVAAVEMAKRGLKLDCLYFHAYPYTSDEALEKVKTLASIIAPYLNGTRLFVVNFTEAQLYLRANAYEDETTLMFRACMMRLAEKLCEKEGLECVVTGEALSQVASQTLSALKFTDSVSDQLVLRPLVAMDKEEIIKIAKQIGTYETSILPYEDCCVIFSPKHPVTNPDKRTMSEHFKLLRMDNFIEKAISEVQVIPYDAKGNEIPL